MKCHLKEAGNNLILGEILIKRGEEVFISEDFRRGNDARDLVKVAKKDGTFIGEFYEASLDIYNNFK